MVEQASLENWNTRKRIVGSNPTLSANKNAPGGGLYLWACAEGRKYWRLRYRIAGAS